MTQRNLTAIIGIGATLAAGAIAYLGARRRKQTLATHAMPRHKHSHIRKSKQSPILDITV